MSVNPKSSVKQNAPARTAVAPPPPPVPVETNTSAKKKKRKKDKARGDASADEDDDDEPPPLEPNPPRATGLSPELAAAHLSTNSPSESPVSATREASQPKTNEPYNPLLEAAAQIPANELSKAQTMYAIAQQMIRTGGKGASKGLPGSYPLENAPFDSAVLSDPAIRRSLEAAFNTANSNGDQVYDNGEFYTEDEGDEDPRYQVEVEVHRDGIETSPAEPQQKLPPQQLVPEQKPVGKKNKKKKKNANTPPQPSTPEPVKARVNPIPGSRAAGKLPMSYTTSNPPSQNPPLAPPSKNSRLASRAPTANNYTTARGRQVPVMTNVSGRGKRSIGSNKQNSNNIWPTNSPEERERIKEFWLKLGERERRDLVKVEKEAVLKKMKEQQRHGCSCAVCGRKRNAIEQELEVLYEAYYEDLEHYANLQQQAASRGLPPPGPGPFPGSVALDKNGQVISAPTPQPKQLSNTRRGQQPNGVRKGQRRTLDEDEYDEDEDDYDDEDYDDEDEMDDEDDIDYEDYNGKGRRKTESKMFSFNSQFTAAGPGNILTVADDLLKNDGQKFLEMMEQLAERRMQREGEAVASIEDDSEDEDEDEDDGDEDEEEEDDSEEDRIMTEEQKMQEGKRMFSVFAARMFEQRVLQAYRERLAWEQKQQILEELRQAAEKRAKQEAEAEKKREKKRLQQQRAKEEARARKEAERAAAEAAEKERRAAAEEAARKRQEEQERRRREAAAAREARLEAARIREAEERKKFLENQRKAAEKAAAEKAALEQRRAAERAAREREKEEERKAREQAQREERERKLREEEAKRRAEKEEAERKAEERQKQAAAAKATAAATAAAVAAASRPAPSPPRTSTTSSTSTLKQVSPAPKKILTKPAAALQTPAPVSAPAPTPTPAPSPAPTPAPVLASAPATALASAPASAPAPAPTPAPTQTITSLPPATPSSSRPTPPRPTVATNTVPTAHIQPQPMPAQTPSSAHPGSFQSQPLPSAPPGLLPIGSYLPPPHQGMPVNGFTPHPSYASVGTFPSQSSQPLPTPLSTPGMPRGYPIMDSNFDSGMNYQASTPVPPIGPPKSFSGQMQTPLTSSSAVSSPIGMGFPGRSDALPPSGPPSHVRRASSAHEVIGRTPSMGYGTIQKPLGPISRPVGVATMDGEDKPPSGSSSRRSPSPTNFLGSKALINDDDELLLPVTGRRFGAAPNNAHMWGAPGEPPKIMEPVGSRSFGGPSAWGYPQQAANNLWGSGPFGAMNGIPPAHAYGVPLQYSNRSPSTPSQSS